MICSRLAPEFSIRLKMEASTSALGKRRSLVSMSQLATTLESIDFWSSRSRMENARVNPRSAAWRRRMRLPIEWKVPAHRSEVSRAMSSRTRPTISRAALLVNVSSSTCRGSTP